MLLDAECLVGEDLPARGASPEQRPPISVRDVRWRNRATLEGRIRGVYVGPVSGSPAASASPARLDGPRESSAHEIGSEC